MGRESRRRGAAKRLQRGGLVGARIVRSCLTGEVIDQWTLACRCSPCPGTEDDGSIGFEFEVEPAITGSAQPVVLHRHSRTGGANRSYHSPIAQIVKFLTACWIETLGQHSQPLPWFSAQPVLDAGSMKRCCLQESQSSYPFSMLCTLQPGSRACIPIAGANEFHKSAKYLDVRPYPQGAGNQSFFRKKQRGGCLRSMT